MIQNTSLMDAALNVAGYVKNHPSITEFISDNFGVDELNVYVGELLRSQIPEAEDTPYLVFYDWKKREGLDHEYNKYSCSIVVGVGSGARPDLVEGDEGTKFLDAYDVSNQFAQLIIDVINVRNNKQRPLSSVEVTAPVPVETDGSHWATIIDCVWRVYNTMGTEQETF